MAVIRSPKIVELAQSKDIKKALIDGVDVSQIETFGENLLVATYIRPERTAGGIIRPQDNIGEDEFQGNVVLVLQIGEGLSEDSEAKELLHQWVRFGAKEGTRWRFNDIPVRDISIDRIRGTVKDPNKVL